MFDYLLGSAAGVNSQSPRLRSEPDTNRPIVRDPRSTMSPSPTDRRVRRTRELLRSALLSLVLEKGYDRITVQDILDRADVGRSTFYAHYRDKEDLLRAGFEDIRAALAAERSAGETEPGSGADVDLLQPLLIVFTHVERHRQFWGPLSRKGGADLITRLLRESVEDLARRHLQAHFGGPRVDPTRLEAAREFVAGACMGLVVWWLGHEDVPSSAEEIHAIFRSLAAPGLERFLAP
jgi:AcrR family transcriptional regulator